MDATNIFNFILGLSGQFAEEATKIKFYLENEYQKILNVGTNNNSDSVIALRETTESVIIFVEELKLKLTQK